MTTLHWLHAHLRSRVSAAPRGRAHDRGEGVISASIAVMVVAFLGALMWIGFQQMWERTEAKTSEQVDRIGG